MISKGKWLTQANFSALVRKNEIKLLGNDYTVTDMEGVPLATEVEEQNPKVMPP